MKDLSMKITNKHNLPAPFVALMSKNYYSKGSSQYSATELMSPPKIVRLREQYNDLIEMDVTKLIASQLGTFMHGKLDAKTVENHINEERLFVEMDGVTVSGQIDVQKITPEGVEIVDYKFVKAWSVMQNKQEWVTQLNIYRWLVWAVKKQYVSRLSICAIIKDYNPHENKEGYPEAEAVMIDVPIWDLQVTEDYVKQRLELHRNAKVSHDFGEELPLCSDEDRWMSETVYAVKRENRKTAIRVFKQKEEAEELAIKEKGYVELRAGEPKRCTNNWCGVAEWCEQFKGSQNVSE
jgi:hypothetical protein